MSLRRLLLLILSGFALMLSAFSSTASADFLDPAGFHLDSPALFVHEHDGQAVINVTRTNTLLPAQVRYGDAHITSSAYQDYTPEGGRLDFAAGQATASFTIPIVDHGIPGPPKTLDVYIYGAYPIGLGVPSKAVLTILNDDVVNVTPVPGNPLALNSTPVGSNPLSGAHFYVDHTWGLAARVAGAMRPVHPQQASLLDVIAQQPETHRFGAWDGTDPSLDVSQFLERAALEEPGTVPMISTYRLEGAPNCGGRGDTPAQAAAYERWIDGFVRGISTYRAVVYLEMDSIITTPCLSSQGVQTRLAELRYAIASLSKLPRVVTYLDAGAADALSAATTARLLREAGVAAIQGFFLNSTHYDWTSREIAYGEAISRMTGGKHFVVNTAVNGRGPLAPRDRVRMGNEVRCNPPGRGLGPKPTTSTGYPNVDAFAWIGNPGRSSGTGPGCGKDAPPTGVFWPAYALMLVKNAVFTVH